MAHSIDDQRTNLTGLQQAALHWWEMHRPIGWTLRQHLDNPRVNTATPAERQLAESVAAAVECGAI